MYDGERKRKRDLGDDGSELGREEGMGDIGDSSEQLVVMGF